jgi:cobalt-zinc-cadmium efflux system outer membrane protein
MKRALLLVVCCIGITANAAPEPPADVTLDAALALYRARNPWLAAREATIDVARADLVDADVYPNPTLGLSAARTVRGSDTIGGTQPGAALDIPILIGRQRAHRSEAANRHVDATRAEVDAAGADGELEVRARFSALLVAQEQVAILDAAVRDARALRDIVAGRTTAGAGSSYAVERMDLAIAMLASRVDEATTLAASASSELAAAVGIGRWHPHASGALLSGNHDARASGSVAASHPALAVDRAAIDAAIADEARAKADGVPTPSLSLGAFATTDPSGIVVSAGVSIPLPFFDRNQGAVARARAEHRRAELDLAATSSELSTDADRADHVLADRRDALAKLTAALDKLGRVRAMAEAAYKNGQGGIVELLDALDAITDARLRELELRGAVAEAELAVRRAAIGR